MFVKNTNILVVGMGLSGLSAMHFLRERGIKAVGVDRNKKLVSQLSEKGLPVFNEVDGEDICSYDLLVISPGIPRSHPYIQQAIDAGIEVIGEVELACRFLSDDQICLGITGTNGKTTVTTLVEHLLNTAGIKAQAIGNIGLPATSAIGSSQSNTKVFVLELSSFQLETFNQTCLDSGVLLNITPDHLDRYTSMDAYAAAKIHMEKCVKNPEKNFFVEEHCLASFQHLFGKNTYLSYGYSSDNHVYTDLVNLFIKDKQPFLLPHKYIGKASHDLENLMAAFALCSQFEIPGPIFMQGLDSFIKPHHRIEFVRSVNGIHYYDDSKGTNIDAVIRAVESIEGTVILIAGGVDKGASYMPWVTAFKGKVKNICAIGQAADKIKNELDAHIPVTLCLDLNAAITCATQFAQVGHTVLLSPGCSSYDMFKDYAHRGSEFQRIVNAY